MGSEMCIRDRVQTHQDQGLQILVRALERPVQQGTDQSFLARQGAQNLVAKLPNQGVIAWVVQVIDLRQGIVQGLPLISDRVHNQGCCRPRPSTLACKIRKQHQCVQCRSHRLQWRLSRTFQSLCRTL